MKTAMILAAGRGERLKPITNDKPKAMCLINNHKPLIAYHVDQLAAAGFEHIIINHAYLGYQIRHYLGHGNHWGINITYMIEPPGALETGGGLFNALALFNNQPIVAVNADIYTNFNFKSLSLPSQSHCHLVLVNNPSHNISGDYGLTADKKLCFSPKTYTFCGIACYHPNAFADCTFGRYSIVDVIQRLIKKKLASGEVFLDPWVDIGTPTRLAQASLTI